MILMSDFKYCYTAHIIEKNAFLYFDIFNVITEDVSVYIYLNSQYICKSYNVQVLVKALEMCYILFVEVIVEGVLLSTIVKA